MGGKGGWARVQMVSVWHFSVLLRFPLCFCPCRPWHGGDASSEEHVSLNSHRTRLLTYVLMAPSLVAAALS